jgi:D-galactarolactone cycloisomerase
MSGARRNLPDLKVDSVTALALRIPRDFGGGIGGAGSPSQLSRGTQRYRKAASFSTVYSEDIECLLVKVTACGLTGWGEAQTPIAPEICFSVLEHLAGPLLIGQSAVDPTGAYNNLYDAMRVRGHSAGFYLDALAALNIALWDIAGQAACKPVHQLLGASARPNIPLYISGLPGATQEEQVHFALERAQEGTSAFKVFWGTGLDDCLRLICSLRDILPETTELYMDALWRMNEAEAVDCARLLLAERVGWLEAPFMPEEIAAHARLRKLTSLPIAIGESYRSSYQFRDIIDAGAASILQPDLGRCGISVSHQIAQWAADNNLDFAPHISISLGPQILAALHVSAVAPTLIRAETNPQVLSVAQMSMTAALTVTPTHFELPNQPGLGASIAQEALAPFIVAETTIN